MSKDSMRYDPATEGLIGEHNGMIVRVSPDAWHQEARDILDPLIPPAYWEGQSCTFPGAYYGASDAILTPTYWLEKGER